MATATFDTLKFANTLKAAGVPEKQAEAQAIAFSDDVHMNFKELATKDDLSQAVKDLRQESQQSAKELRQEIRDLREEQKTNLKEEVLKLNSKMDTLYAKLVGEMTLLKWMFGLNITVLVGILIRLFVFRTA